MGCDDIREDTGGFRSNQEWFGGLKVCFGEGAIHRIIVTARTCIWEGEDGIAVPAYHSETRIRS